MLAAIRCSEDDQVRSVVLTGSGRMFCAGGDVAGFAEQKDALPAYVKELTTYLHAAVAAFAYMEKPIVTAVNGPAAGAGMGLALLGDLVLASPTAHFTVAYTRIGMSPDGGVSWLLPKLVGLRRAQELCLCNRRVSAEEAVAMGLITRVVADDLLAHDALALADEFAQGARCAMSTTRRLLLESHANSIEAQMDMESRGITAQARSPEGREGIAAFLEKRPPSFQAHSQS